MRNEVRWERMFPDELEAVFEKDMIWKRLTSISPMNIRKMDF